jgi:hypothetical protein
MTPDREQRLEDVLRDLLNVSRKLHCEMSHDRIKDEKQCQQCKLHARAAKELLT